MGGMRRKRTKRFTSKERKTMTLRKILSEGHPDVFLARQVERGSIYVVSPYLAALRMKGNGGAHKDVLNHSIKVLGNAISHEDDGVDVVLRAAALLHDVGKPATRRISRGKATFKCHDAVGARMIPEVLDGHGFSSREVKQIAELVRLHMRSHGFRDKGRQVWSESAVRRFMSNLPKDEDQVRRLFIIFKSDTTSKHKSKRDLVVRAVEALEAEMGRVSAKDTREAMRPALDGNEVMKMTGLTPGPELGRIMKFLNSDEGVCLSRAEAVDAIWYNFILPETLK